MIDEYGDLFIEVAGIGSSVMCPKIKWFERDYPKRISCMDGFVRHCKRSLER